MFRLMALCLMAEFYGVYFSKMLLQRGKGIRTDHMGKGKNGEAKWIEILLKACSLLVLGMELFSIFLSWNASPTALRVFGVILALLGDIIFTVSVISMRDSWRAGVSEEEKTDLVTSGIYAWSRNPAFLGFDLVYMGILLLFWNGLLLVVTLLAMVFFHLQIVRVEEPFLERVFGEPYLSYMKMTNRYLGKHK